jgi:hypothetical protein
MKHDQAHESVQNAVLKELLDALIAHVEGSTALTVDKLKAARAMLDADDAAPPTDPAPAA